MTKEPNNFSWIDPHIAGSAKPYTLENLLFYKNQNINHVVSLTGERPLVMYHKSDIPIKDYHFRVFSTPSTKVVKSFLSIVEKALEKNEKVVVHCEYGQERTGMMLAIYLVEFKKYMVDDAIQFVRNKRPGSLRMPTSIEYLKNRYR